MGEVFGSKGNPAYADLPVHPELGMRHSWDVWPPDDAIGTINRITDESTAAAAREIRTGRRFNLSLPLEVPDPPLFGRKPFKHSIIKLDRRTYDDYVDGLFLQGSSQWDSLLHVRAGKAGLYKGRREEPQDYVDAGGAGLEAWADHGIAARGVLLDVSSYLADRGEHVRAGQSRSFSPALLADVADQQGVTFQTGDILMIRTGWLASYLISDAAERERLANCWEVPGLHAGEETAAFLWDTGCAAVTADNPSLEVAPGDPEVGWLHRRLIPMLGFALGELWNFEELAAVSAADGRYTSCVVAIPLNLSAAIGSPANALAIR
jgi:kynurenine formamidase